MTHDWMDSALCTQVGPDLFHADGPGCTQYTEARKICAACPVTDQCAAFAQAAEGTSTHNYRHGLWGGQAPRRRALVGTGRGER